MKTTKQIINEMEKEFDEKFRDMKDSWNVDVIGYNVTKQTVKDFYRKHIPTLLSAFAEEVIGKEEEILTAHELMTKNKSMNKSIADWEEGKQMGKSVLRAGQRLKAKEIISEIGK